MGWSVGWLGAVIDENSSFTSFIGRWIASGSIPMLCPPWIAMDFIFEKIAEGFCVPPPPIFKLVLELKLREDSSGSNNRLTDPFFLGMKGCLTAGFSECSAFLCLSTASCVLENRLSGSEESSPSGLLEAPFPPSWRMYVSDV